MPSDETNELTKLRAALDDVTRREAAFRLKAAKEYLATEAKLRGLEERIKAMDTYVHELHVTRDDLRAQVQAARADVETLTWMLYPKERDAESLARAKKSAFWFLVSGAAKLPRSVERLSTVPAGDYIYYLHTSPYRIYRPGSFTLRGWVMPKDGRATTAVRVAIDEKTFYGRFGLEEPEVIVQHGAQAAKNPKPGFEIAFEITLGRHQLAVEAQVENDNWQTVVSTPVWCIAAQGA
ncbi:MAG TPA: hypothetical protein VFT72_20020 [Opitutaceae bacterium]|nr:hypothetical protein [Opitutaceae bacterium]